MDETAKPPAITVVGADKKRRAPKAADILLAGDSHAIMVDGQRLALSAIPDYKKPAPKA